MDRFMWTSDEIGGIKFLDRFFIKTRTSHKYFGIFIFALSRTKDVF